MEVVMMESFPEIRQVRRRSPPLRLESERFSFDCLALALLPQRQTDGFPVSPTRGCMQVTRAADLGVRVMTHLAMLPFGTRMTVTALADRSEASVPFTGRVLQRLVGARLVVSHRGHVGGFELARMASRISMLDIVSAIEGPLCLNDCLPGGSGCPRKAWCSAHDVWTNAQQALSAALASESLEGLASKATSNRARLGMSAWESPLSITGGTSHV
jgi:Rrf2 family protein